VAESAAAVNAKPIIKAPTLPDGPKRALDTGLAWMRAYSESHKEALLLLTSPQFSFDRQYVVRTCEGTSGDLEHAMKLLGCLKSSPADPSDGFEGTGETNEGWPAKEEIWSWAAKHREEAAEWVRGWRQTSVGSLNFVLGMREERVRVLLLKWDYSD